ncbi:MAG: hypothetical protein KJ072_05290 [Verrucomicrobia bacterium]|nr:hypothetical protein [Verrucomicrobiota bacterium]
MPSIEAMQVDGAPEVKVTCDPLDLSHFLNRDFLPMNLMCDRAQMFERYIADRTKAVFDYFGLPLDAEPPPNPAKGHLCH